MKTPYIILIIIAMLIALILLFAVAYTYTAAYQQTISVTLPLDNTYIYQNKSTIKIDHVKIVVTGNMNPQEGTIISSSTLKELMQKHIIYPNTNSIFIYEKDMFLYDETYPSNEMVGENVRYHSWSTMPSLETFSIFIFKNFQYALMEEGCQLVSVNIVSNGVKVSHHRYKVSNYKLPPKL